jgi:uncharacterized spore protein YtfJ
MRRTRIRASVGALAHPHAGKEPIMAETESTPHARGDRLLSKLAEQLGERLTASAVYGQPVERDGVTVVPVATARFGMGAGSGTDPSKHQEGEGGGIGGTVTPAGYIELKDGGSRFVPVVHPARMVALFAGVALAGLLALARAQRPPERRSVAWTSRLPWVERRKS